MSFSQLYRDSLSNIITRVHTAATNLYSAIANTRNLSRRNFILETWSEINALYPVIIATPDEVSRYIPSDSDIFDYVIFDESSQMTLQMSIPSISRGKKFILIGDQDQMPPSRGQGLVEYSDSDSTDTDSSILDNVISLNRDISNVYTLGTHYRSKYYRLFQPSQEAIYKGKTTAIYEAHSTNHNPIEFVYCPLSAPRNLNTEVTSGDKKNMVSIIEKAKLLLQQSNSSTVLIIAMNLKMMDEIDNIVRAQYSELLPLVENSRLIVKNLETCQGQDVTHSIIYFHYDTLSHVPFFNDNFGSYKRLNVAITRQQESLIIFHTASRSDWVSKAQLKYDDVQSSDYSRKSGLLILKLFGAHNEVQESEINNKLSDISLYFDSPFEESFYNIIVSQKWFQDLGYKLVPQVSESKFRIDFGVYDPENHSYVLGIELDGAMYHSGLSKEFADLSRQSVLESKGWEIYRIWSTDWSNNIKKEISLLETILKQKKYRTK